MVSGRCFTALLPRFRFVKAVLSPTMSGTCSWCQGVTRVALGSQRWGAAALYSHLWAYKHTEVSNNQDLVHVRV